MLLNELGNFMEEVMILFDKLEYLEEQGQTNMRMRELYKEFKRILLLESVTDSIRQLQDFIDMFDTEIEHYYSKKISMMMILES